MLQSSYCHKKSSLVTKYSCLLHTQFLQYNSIPMYVICVNQLLKCVGEGHSPWWNTVLSNRKKRVQLVWLIYTSLTVMQSNYKVLGLMLLYKYDLAHKSTVSTLLFHVMSTRINDKTASSISSSVAAPVSSVFFVTMEQHKHHVLFKTQENS